MARFLIRPFTPTDQTNAKALILAGLGERFGYIDYSLNQDINDIWAAYINAGNLFIVVETDGKLIGTGALIQESSSVGRIVRMSVAPNFRRQGIARTLVLYLIEAAKQRDYRQILVETNSDWHSARKLYRNCGFQFVEKRDGETHMKMEIRDL